MYKNIFTIIILLLISIVCNGCYKTITETQIEYKYIHPEVPASIIEPCSQIEAASFTTNGELLMAYISLQSSYIICASKVTSIKSILDSYNTIYTSETPAETTE